MVILNSCRLLSLPRKGKRQRGISLTGGSSMAGKSQPAAQSAKVRELPDGAPGGDGLTGRQRLIIDMIRTAVDKRGYPPTMREIGEAVGLTSPSSVAHQLATLERKGYLKRDPHRPRALEITRPGSTGGNSGDGIDGR